MSAPEVTQARIRFPGVRKPRPLMPPETEKRLTIRQRELLAALEALVATEELGGWTMAEIAARVNCSLRTLYGIAPSKDELVLTVVDRRMHRIGRAAIGSLDASLGPMASLRAYLRATNEAVQPETAAFSLDFAGVPGAKRMLDAHEGYVMAVTQSLLDRAVAEGEIDPIDTAAVAHVLGGLGREFARPENAELAAVSPKVSADGVADILLRGLERGASDETSRVGEKAATS